jgi:hypothetical protein
MGSGVLLVIATLLESISDSDLFTGALDGTLAIILPLPPLLLLLIALPKIAHANQGTSASGGLGGIGFVLTVTGLLVVLSAFLVVALFPDESRVAQVSYLAGGALLLIGTLFFAVATRRAGVFPRGGGLLLVLGWVGYWVSPAIDSPPLFFVPALCLFGAAWIWLGYMLVTERPAILSNAEVTAREGHTMPPPPPPPPGR